MKTAVICMLCQILCEAFWMYLREEKGVTEGPQLYHMEPFYQVPLNAPRGTNSYIVRATLNQLLDSEFRGVRDAQCCVS